MTASDYVTETYAALCAWGYDVHTLTPAEFQTARAMVKSDAEGTSVFDALTTEQRNIARRMGWAA